MCELGCAEVEVMMTFWKEEKGKSAAVDVEIEWRFALQHVVGRGMRLKLS